MRGPRRQLASLALALTAAVAVALHAQQTPPTRPHHPGVPYQSPTTLGAATYAKILCPAVLVSSSVGTRQLNEALLLITAAIDDARRVGRH